MYAVECLTAGKHIFIAPLSHLICQRLEQENTIEDISGQLLYCLIFMFIENRLDLSKALVNGISQIFGTCGTVNTHSSAVTPRVV